MTWQGGEFENLSGVGTSRLGWDWEKAMEDNQNQTVLSPGESMIAESNVRQGYYLQSAIGFVMYARFEYDDGQKKKVHLKIYSIPIPYTYQEGD